MADWAAISSLLFGCVLVLYIGRRGATNRHSPPLPPGPTGIPWVGNIIGVNTSAPWITYAEWARTYGNLVYSQLLGKDVIIINSEEVAKDLLEKRSKNYSDRPYLVTNELCGVGFNSILLPYGNRWRLHKRFFHQTFRADVSHRFLSLQYDKACQFLRQLFTGPEQLDDHVFEYTTSVVLNSTYDYNPLSRKDEIVDIAADVLNIAVPAVRPDVAIIVGAFPFLLHLPSWFPGMSFKEKMAVARTHTKKYLEQPFAYSLRKMEKPDGNIGPSMVHDGLQHMQGKEGLPENEWLDALKDACGTSFLAGSESSHTILMTFFLMMMINPGAQEKAQAQIDAIVGKSRLPGIEDRPLLPFVDAIFWEILRYNPSLPLLIPHAVVDDDVYNGFHIPKGALVIANVWAMAHDKSRYPNPHAFVPERFLNDDGSLKPNDVEYITFGFGRRICPGRHFADTSVWGVIARVLAMFKILKPLDEDGFELPVEAKFSSGIVVHPLPFKCRIIPRSPGMDVEKLEELIAASTA